MAKKTTKMRHDIIRSLVDINAPAGFTSIRGKTQVDVKKRNLIHYHIEQLVKEGFVLSQKNGKGETIYRANPVFYDPVIWDLLKASVDASLKISDNVHCSSTRDAWRCLIFMLEMMEPSSKH